jgi:hypothetical protein
MPWCDTIPAMLTAFIALGLFFMAALFNAGSLTLWPLAVVKAVAHLTVVIVFPLWFVLRVIDWLCAGPARRAAQNITGAPPVGR